MKVRVDMVTGKNIILHQLDDEEMLGLGEILDADVIFHINRTMADVRKEDAEKQAALDAQRKEEAAQLANKVARDMQDDARKRVEETTMELAKAMKILDE